MPRLVIKQGDGVGRDHTLGAGDCVVGRDPSADFVLEERGASRRHFRVYQDAGQYFVEDLGSTNGTRVNGRRAKRWKLTDGDRIQVGKVEMTFVQKDPFAAPTPTKPAFQAPVRRRRRR